MTEELWVVQEWVDFEPEQCADPRVVSKQFLAHKKPGAFEDLPYSPYVWFIIIPQIKSALEETHVPPMEEVQVRTKDPEG